MKENTMTLTYRNRVVLIATLMASIICAPLQAWNIQPSSYGKQTGLALLGIAASYGVYRMFSAVSTQLHRPQFAAIKKHIDNNRYNSLEVNKKAQEKEAILQAPIKGNAIANTTFVFALITPFALIFDKTSWPFFAAANAVSFGSLYFLSLQGEKMIIARLDDEHPL